MKVKLGLSDLNPLQLLERSQFIVGRLTGNPDYPGPINPTLASIQTAIDNLAASNEAALTGSHLNIQIRNNDYEVLLEQMRQLGSFVQNASGGVGTVIASSGFEVVQPRTPSVVPAKVEHLVATISGYAHSVLLEWKSFGKKATGYIVEFSVMDPTNPSAEWTIIGNCTKAKFLAENLPIQNQYGWFRVYATNSAGNGVVSDPAMCMVL